MTKDEPENNAPSFTYGNVSTFDAPVTVTHFKQKYDNDASHQETLQWSAFAAPFGSTDYAPRVVTSCDPCPGKDCPYKNGPAWTFCSYHATPDVAPKRKKTNVARVYCLGIDVDNVHRALFEDILEQFVAHELEHIWYTTHSHRPDLNVYKLRIVIPLVKPVKGLEWGPFWRDAIFALGLNGLVDEACKDPSRLFFKPSTPRQFAEHAAHDWVRGNPFKIEDIPKYRSIQLINRTGPTQRVHVETFGQTTTPPPHSTPTVGSPTAPPPPTAPPVDLNPLWERLLKTGNAESNALMHRIKRGESFADVGGRHNALVKTAAIINAVLKSDVAIGVKMYLIEPSLRATPLDPGQSFASFYAHALRVFEDFQVKQNESEQSHERFVQTLKDIGRGPPPPVEPAPREARQRGKAKAKLPDPLSSEALEAKLHRNDKGRPIANDFNLKAILLLDTKLRTADRALAFRFNQLTRHVVLSETADWTASDDIEDIILDISTWLNDTYGIQPRKHELGGAIVSYARRHAAYNPVVDWLTECRMKWDDKPRVEDFLTTYCNANVDKYGSSYIKAISKKWFISAVARAFEPGCKVDTMLVLLGPEGARKTTLVETLANYGEFYRAFDGDVASKDSKQANSSAWIIEFGELSSLKRSTSEAFYQYMTTPRDDFRPPYGQDIKQYPRRCVFVGTGNHDEFIAETEGSRRFWPIEVTHVQLEDVKADLALIWGEAVALYEAGEQWYLTESERASSRAINEITHTRESRNAWRAEPIIEWWQKQEPSKRPSYVTLASVATDIFDLDDPAELQRTCTPEEFGKIMRTLGFVKKRIGKYKTTRYEPSDALRDMPRVTPAQARAAEKGIAVTPPPVPPKDTSNQGGGEP